LAEERLLNVAIKSVPENAKNIAWLDCDVIFERTDWMHEAELKLSEVNIVQLYSDLIDLGPEGFQSSINCQGLRLTGHGIVSLGLRQLTAATSNEIRLSLPGLAWAARRGILEEHGFYDALLWAVAIRRCFTPCTVNLNMNSNGVISTGRAKSTI
jgi:hypothetical protein